MSRSHSVCVTVLLLVQLAYSQVPGIKSLDLVDAVTGEFLMPLERNSVINLRITGINLSVRANLTSDDPGVSVLFGIDNDAFFKIENTPPFYIRGDFPNGQIESWTPTVGHHMMTVTPYSEQDAQGTAGPRMFIWFTVTAFTAEANKVISENRRTTASECPSTQVSLGSVGDGTTDLQQVAMTFFGIDAEDGINIGDAFVTFVATENMAGAMSVLIRAHKTFNSPNKICGSAAPVSSLSPLTSARAVWDTRTPWVAGREYDTPNIGHIVQEVVNEVDGWLPGDPLVLVFQGIVGLRAVSLRSHIKPTLTINAYVPPPPTTIAPVSPTTMPPTAAPTLTPTTEPPTTRPPTTLAPTVPVVPMVPTAPPTLAPDLRQVVALFGQSNDLEALYNASGHTILRRPSDFTNVDVAILMDEFGSEALLRWVIAGGKLITEGDGNIWVARNLFGVNARRVSGTNGISMQTTVFQSLTAGVPSNLQDGVRTSSLIAFDLPTRKREDGNDLVVVGNASPSGEPVILVGPGVVLLGFDWSNGLSAASDGTKTLVNNAAVMGVPLFDPSATLHPTTQPTMNPATPVMPSMAPTVPTEEPPTQRVAPTMSPVFTVPAVTMGPISQEKEGSSTNTGLIVGLVVGIVVVLLVFGFLVWKWEAICAGPKTEDTEIPLR